MTRSQPASSRFTPEPVFDTWLLRIVDAGLAAIVLIAPYLLGGRFPVGRLCLVSCVCVTAIAWLVRYSRDPARGWNRSGAEWLLLAGILLVGFQLVPLPPAILSRVSPAIGKLLPLWTESTEPAVQLGVWSTVSLFPEATRGGLVMLLTYGMLFLLMIQRIRSVSDAERVMRLLAVAAVCMAALGLLQYLLGNGKFLWVYEHPFSSTSKAVKGPFPNENHFAHFLALGIGPLLWWVQHQTRRHSRSHQDAGHRGRRGGSRQDLGKVALAAGIAIVAFSGLLTFSRGGVLMIMLAATVCVGLYVSRSLLARQSLLMLALVAVLSGAALWIHGYQNLSHQLATIHAGSLDELNQSLRREVVWGASLRAIPEFLRLGAGIGTQREIYQRYLLEPSPVEFTHAESGYLQTLCEAGLPGMSLVAAGLGLAGFWCWRGLFQPDRPDITAISGAAASGLAVSIVHSVSDFVWYVPACVSVTVVLLACACRMQQLAVSTMSRYRIVPNSRWIPIAGLTTVSIASALMIAHWIPAARASADWDQYARLSSPERNSPRWFAIDAGAGSPTGAGPSRTELIYRLERILERNPADAQAHQNLARLYLYEFESRQSTAENAIPVNQIRDAAIASDFHSRRELDRWLSMAVGENRDYLDRSLGHAHCAVRSCPLQGEAYLSLAELLFLEGRPDSAKYALLDQALLVRPQDGTVLTQAGIAAGLKMDVPAALDYWKRAFHSGPATQSRIVQSLSDPIARMLQEPNPASYFLEHFDPDFTETRLMYASYRRAERTDQAKIVGARYIRDVEEVARAAKGPEAAEWWLEAQDVYALLGEPERAVECAQLAVQSAPSDPRCHRILANRLADANRIADAIDQLHWCQKRSPDDQRLQAQLKQLYRQLDREPQVSTNPEGSSTRR